MDNSGRTDRMRLGGRRWYDRLVDELKQHERALKKVGEAYRSLDQLLSEPDPEAVYFTGLGQTESLVHQIQDAYAQLSTLPNLLDKYSAAMAFHTRKARKIVKDQIVTDPEITRQGEAYSERLAEISDKIESYYEGFWGLTSKMRKMNQLLEEAGESPISAEKTVRAIRRILYGGWIKRWNAAARFKEIFEELESLSRYELAFKNEINYHPFEKLRKIE